VSDIIPENDFAQKCEEFGRLSKELKGRSLK
jgi:hypothetical protein